MFVRLFLLSPLVLIVLLGTFMVVAVDATSCPNENGPPDYHDKAATARWMVHTLEWGVLSTISSRLKYYTDEKEEEKDNDSDSGSDDRSLATSRTRTAGILVAVEDGDPQINAPSLPVPFGNIYSFVDGPCHNSTGIIYLYGTFMDQSFQDIHSNPVVSFTLSKASLPMMKMCRTIGFGDPENPLCARLTVTGLLQVVPPHHEDIHHHHVDIPKTTTKTTTTTRASKLGTTTQTVTTTITDATTAQHVHHSEWYHARKALFERHPSMLQWPQDHDWVVAKLIPKDIWLIDYFGGATIVNIHEYFAV